MKWYEKLTLNWRKTSAKALFRYIRNDNKIPHPSFPDPDNGGHLTADPTRIDELFRQQWHDVYNTNEEKPSWEKIYDKYGDYIVPFEGIDASPLSAREMHRQAHKAKSGAGGLDGWTPAEFKLMPSAVWEDRVLVEECIMKARKYPSVYYHAPIVLLRTGEGEPPNNTGASPSL